LRMTLIWLLFAAALVAVFKLTHGGYDQLKAYLAIWFNQLHH